MNKFKERYGPYALITGASSGIGAEFARQLAGNGLNLILVARRKDRLENIASDLRSRYDVEVRIAPVDLSQEDLMVDIRPRIEDIEIGMLVNNAGFATSGPFIESDLDREIEMLHVNARAPLILTREIAPGMLKRGKGGIIFLSSVAGLISLPYMSNYAATKAYDINMAEALWYEFRKQGVDVLALAPGIVRTEFGKVAGIGSGFGLMDPKEVVKKAIQRLGKTPYTVPGVFFRIIATLSRLGGRRLLVRISGALWTRYIMDRKHIDCLEKHPEDECN